MRSGKIPKICDTGSFKRLVGEHQTEHEEKEMSKLTLKTEGDTQVVVTRFFAAPPADALLGIN